MRYKTNKIKNRFPFLVDLLNKYRKIKNTNDYKWVDIKYKYKKIGNR